MKIKPFIRKTTSLTAMWSFIILVISSIIIYAYPHGRGSGWTALQWFGMNRSQWFQIHINVGFLMIAACILHLLLNLKPIIKYLTSKVGKVRISSAELIISLVITGFFIWGTYTNSKPISSINELGLNLRQKSIQKYGRPPYARAEQSSLLEFCDYMGYDPEFSIDSLRKSGFDNIELKDTLLQISKNNGSYPQEIYNIIFQSALEADQSGPDDSIEQQPIGRGQGGPGRGLRRRNRTNQGEIQ